MVRFQLMFLKILPSNKFLKFLSTIYIMLSLLKYFQWHTMFQCIVSGFSGFFSGIVLVNVFENIIVEQRFLRPFIWYNILFCSSNICWFLDLYISWENEKSLRLSGFELPFSPLIFFIFFFSKTMIDTKLKLLGCNIYDKIYRLVSNRRMSTVAMLRWYVLTLNMCR